MTYDQGAAPVRGVEEQVKDSLPSTDSIQELADFWDAHDVTDFDDELIEVPSPFAAHAQGTVAVPLSDDELTAVRRIAASRGVEEGTLIHEWVREKIGGS